jgi:hypothetical protein
VHFRKLVKVTIKTDRRQWLESVDDSLKTHPQHFWKYFFNFKRKDNFFIQLKIDDQFLTDPKHTAGAFATYFESILTHLVCPSLLILLLQILYPLLLSLMLKSARLLSAIDVRSVLDRWNPIFHN